MKQPRQGHERPADNTVHDRVPQVTAPADARTQDNSGEDAVVVGNTLNPNAKITGDPLPTFE